MSNKPETTKFSFWKLLDKYTIEIPIMQRDYAQGRQSEKVTLIRGELLQTIHKAIEDDSNSVDFDFIYGTVLGEEKLLPLDGQQRLTTLFLLHWYLAKKDGCYDNQISNKLYKFTYATRVSSKDFCKNLVKMEFELPEFSMSSVAQKIRNCNWYYESWDKDPTIKSMLVMLDEIHRIFYNTKGMFEKLTREVEDNPPVTFRFVPLENYGLTDNLYIKMNARGKALSDFENFKARFSKILREKGFKDKADYFEMKIDNEWTDLFWGFRENNTIDNPFMRYFQFISEMIYAKSNNRPNATSPFRNNGNVPVVDFKLISNTYNKEENIDILFSALDMWKNKAEMTTFINSILTTENDGVRVKMFDSNSNLFDKCITGKAFQLNEKIILFSIILRKISVLNEMQTENMNDYVRVIRNLLTRVRQLQDIRYSSNLRYENAYEQINSICDKLIFNENIYFIISKLDELPGFAKDNFADEKDKAEIIIKHPNYKKEILKTEDLDMFRGCLHNVINLLIKETVDISKVFNNIYTCSNTSLISRAMLSIGDYSIRFGGSALGDRFHFGTKQNWHTVLTYKNLGKQVEIRTFFYNFIIRYIESVESTVEEKLSGIIKSQLSSMQCKDWRYYFVKYTNMYGMSDMNYAFANKKNDNFRIRRLRGNTIIAYHINPYYRTVALAINDKNICNEDVCYGRYSEEGELRLANGILLSLDKEGWLVSFPPTYEESRKKVLIEDYHISVTTGRIEKNNADIVEMAIEFINATIS